MLPHTGRHPRRRRSQEAQVTGRGPTPAGTADAPASEETPRCDRPETWPRALARGGRPAGPRCPGPVRSAVAEQPGRGRVSWSCRRCGGDCGSGCVEVGEAGADVGDGEVGGGWGVQGGEDLQGVLPVLTGLFAVAEDAVGAGESVVCAGLVGWLVVVAGKVQGVLVGG